MNTFKMLFAGMLAVGAPGMAEAQANAADSVMNHANGRQLAVRPLLFDTKVW